MNNAIGRGLADVPSVWDVAAQIPCDAWPPCVVRRSGRQGTVTHMYSGQRGGGGIKHMLVKLYISENPQAPMQTNLKRCSTKKPYIKHGDHFAVHEDC